jgi:hypothetical protein
VRTSELVVQRGADITTAGTISALDVSNISLVRLTAATVLQGIAAPASLISNGKKVTLVNANSVSLTVSNESGSATAANRISTGTSRDLVITAGASVTLFYNTASSRWSVESSSGEVNIDRLRVSTESIVLNSQDLTPSVLPKSGLIELTAGSETSIRSIATGVNGQFLAIVNKTGSLLQIVNEDLTATDANRLVTGTGSSISLTNNAALFLTYLSSVSKWQIVGGTGSGGEPPTEMSLPNNTTRTVKDVSSYETGELSGMVFIANTTSANSKRFHFKAQFAKNGANTDYNIGFQTTGDTPPDGFNIGITSAGLIQITLPNISGFSAATAKFTLGE